MAHGYWFDEVNCPSKILKKAKKQAKAYYELLGGDYAICGEPNDDWNTKVIPERKKKEELKQKSKIQRLIEKNDKNKDGKLDERDF